jgi:hypothetical protein
MLDLNLGKGNKIAFLGLKKFEQICLTIVKHLYFYLVSFCVDTILGS